MNQSHSRPAYGAEPRWRWQRHFLRQAYDLPRWILDKCSLTDRLIAASGGSFAVVRRRQNWCLPLASERHLLGLSCRCYALVREVQLECAGIPWVFARSVIPASTCTGDLRHLRGLQNRSLGSLLFNDPNLVRGPFELAIITQDSTYIPPDLPRDSDCWGRRSVFRIDNKKVMVSEVFLPSFQPWTSSVLHNVAPQSKL